MLIVRLAAFVAGQVVESRYPDAIVVHQAQLDAVRPISGDEQDVAMLQVAVGEVDAFEFAS